MLHQKRLNLEEKTQIKDVIIQLQKDTMGYSKKIRHTIMLLIYEHM